MPITYPDDEDESEQAAKEAYAGVRMVDGTREPQGPLYEYMMGTFDLGDPTWMNSMNDMLNNFGLAGWKRSVVTLLDARHLLVAMERRWPTAAEYQASVVADVRQLKDEATIAHNAKVAAAQAATQPEADEADEVDEYDDEAEAMMVAKVAEVIPWARGPKVPQNGRRKRKGHKKVSAIAQRNKVAT